MFLSYYGYEKQHEGKNRNKFNETSTVMRRTEKNRSMFTTGRPES